MKKQLSQLLLVISLCLACMTSYAALPLADEIVVFKSERALALVHEGKIYKVYDIVLGQNPVGDKVEQGDHRTPEGDYVIDYKNPRSRYYLSLHISYPNEQDLEEAQALGVNAGNHITIHGMKNQKGKKNFFSKAKDWTQGCISVTNKDMREIWKLVPEGTPIRILP